MIVKQENRLPRELQPGVSHAVLAFNDALMLCEVSIAAGVTFPEHGHPHTQAVYVVSGSVRFTLGDRVVELGAGDSCVIPPDVIHGLVALSDARVIDAFTPVREDLLPHAPIAL